jgi:hypothetical protein
MTRKSLYTFSINIFFKIFDLQLVEYMDTPPSDMEGQVYIYISH